MRQIFIRMRIVTLVLFMAVVGCAVPRVGILLPDGSTVYEIYPRVEFIDDEWRAVPVEHSPKDMKLIFPSISGQIDGMFASAPLQIIRVTNGSEFRLDLGGMTRSIHDASKTLVKNMLTRGLSIVPPSTKLARVATLAVDADTGKSIGGAGFIHPESRDYVILVYVDRPCSLTGTLLINGLSIEHDVRLGSSGFHWLRYHRLEEGGLLLKEHPGGDDVSFSIQVDEP